MLKRVETSGNTCPCCGQHVDTSDLLVSLDANAAARNGVLIRLEPQSTVILYELKRVYPAKLPTERLLQALNGAHESQSQDPMKVLHVRISRLRSVIKPLGLTIPAGQWQGGYRLQFE